MVARDICAILQKYSLICKANPAMTGLISTRLQLQNSSTQVHAVMRDYRPQTMQPEMQKKIF